MDLTRARAELETLLAAATPDGFIGHTIFWGEPVTPTRSLFYNLRERHDFMTSTIQPPLLAWAWKLVVGNPADVPAIVRHQDWVERERAIDGDGLLWIIQPDEAGLDASPRFDSASADRRSPRRSSSGSTMNVPVCSIRWCADGR